MNIREFRVEDMQTVTAMLQSVSRYEPNEEDLERLANSFITGENRFACVASVHSQVIGFGSLFLLKRIRGGCSGVVEDVVVDKNFRRQGVGRGILRELIAYARQKGCFKVTLVAEDHNIMFYESLGFREYHKSMRLLLVGPMEGMIVA